ncbi:hypothetical protein PSCICE_08290 [Pseudomonas cichorii]|nr:hypothetical protein PSCICE_08290 [Pseudomonas cichorii]
MSATQADQPIRTLLNRTGQMVGKLEPLVTADKRIDKIQPQNRDFDASLLQPGQVQKFKGSGGLPGKCVIDHGVAV